MLPPITAQTPKLPHYQFTIHYFVNAAIVGKCLKRSLSPDLPTRFNRRTHQLTVWRGNRIVRLSRPQGIEAPFR